jgi:hypothetical protein
MSLPEDIAEIFFALINKPAAKAKQAKYKIRTGNAVKMDEVRNAVQANYLRPRK